MRIDSSIVTLNSVHSATTAHEVRESLRVSVVPSAPTPAVAQDSVSLSQQAKVSWPPTEKPDPSSPDLDLASGLDPEMRMIKALVERLFGITIKVLSPRETEGAGDKGKAASPEQRPQAAPAISVAYDRQETLVDTESTTVVARGVVKTADGKAIDFRLSVAMSRTAVSQSAVSERAGAAVQDPLVINFAGTAAQLTDAHFEFDLNADGAAESVAFVRAGSGMLALDRNGDGKVNDGRELFGPATGNGFAELASFDVDGNRWIDQADPVFSNLRVWTKDEAGQDNLATLGESGVGAIHLDPVASSFDLVGADQATAGVVRSTSVYLSESGQAGSVQQVDLVV